jgi:hypothetical protein
MPSPYVGAADVTSTAAAFRILRVGDPLAGANQPVQQDQADDRQREADEPGDRGEEDDADLGDAQGSDAHASSVATEGLRGGCTPAG